MFKAISGNNSAEPRGRLFFLNRKPFFLMDHLVATLLFDEIIYRAVIKSIF